MSRTAASLTLAALAAGALDACSAFPDEPTEGTGHPGGTTLRTGDAFDDSTAPFAQDSLPALLLDFCAIDSAPVAFADAASITALD